MNGEYDGTEPELPTLPPPSTAPARLRKLPPIFARIPSHGLDFPGTSSDPPIFSSDDVPEGSENYSIRRKKKSRLGPWWESSQPLQPRKKRKTEKITRNFDSGVFMGVSVSSEGSFPSSDLPSSELGSTDLDTVQEPHTFTRSQPVPVSKALTLSQEMMPPPAEDDYTRWGPPKDLVNSFYCPGEDRGRSQPDMDAVRLASSQLSDTGNRREETLMDTKLVKSPNACRHLRLRLSKPVTRSNRNHSARLIVDRAVETGCEDIDLSGQMVWHEKGAKDGQDRPDDRIFHPLHHLVKTRAIYDPDRYDSLIPDMRLWLSDNRLEMLPNEVYRLRNLTQLGLRQNQIRTLSPSVRQLVRLQLLNLSGNPVAYLPWEITRLSSLTTLLIDVAYSYQPVTNRDLSESTAYEKAHADRWIVEMVSATSWLDKIGIPIHNSVPRPSNVTSFDPSSRTSLLSKPPTDEYESRARSLFDSCVKTIAALPEAESILFGRDACPLPAHHLATLRSAYQIEQTGGTICSVCDRSYTVPRAEWIEWASRGKQTRKVPLVRTTCSWACARQHFDAWMDLESSRRSRYTRKPIYHPNVVMNCGWRSGT